MSRSRVFGDAGTVSGATITRVREMTVTVSGVAAVKLQQGLQEATSDSGTRKSFRKLIK